jgi:nitrilase
VTEGGSCVVGPLGELVAGPVYGEECVLTADLDRADLARAKFDFDAVGTTPDPTCSSSTSTNDR